MAKILIIGDIYFESQFFVDEIPHADQVSLTDEITNIIGSKTINVARTLSVSGNEVSFFANVGNDAFGQLARERFKLYEVSTDLIRTVKDHPTGQITVITEKSGKSSITLFRGANNLVSASDIGNLAKEFKAADLVYTGTHLALDVVYKIVDVAKNENTKLFIDPMNQMAKLDVTKLNGAAFLAPNRQELGIISKTEISSIEEAKLALIRLSKDFQGTILATLDRDGAVLLEQGGGEVKYFPAKKVEAIDETAAGDIFRAVFVNTYLKTGDVSVAVKTALARATESTTIKGVDNTIRGILFRS